MSTARTGAALTGRLSQQGSRDGNGNHRPYVARYRSARAAQRRLLRISPTGWRAFIGAVSGTAVSR
ncbi:hypothetical protein PV379_35890 [Streptomyces caniscabiei]|uniref:hypothetical protein n=1 Tax=Streptomyces caniscabiei TaxID=2746961 RepID=UPI0029B20B87|nr:hypothetical protein [Streptomyces caniscabiei]MDX2604142.1 hypothetical protein [Streptomyces caniscabiei]MDX2739277.1 hypothetical protein [Streptomyces caniscabiei]MDX2782647.1 hypothetical protein [Streptomyces caniscabiei]